MFVGQCFGVLFFQTARSEKTKTKNTEAAIEQEDQGLWTMRELDPGLSAMPD